MSTRSNARQQSILVLILFAIVIWKLGSYAIEQFHDSASTRLNLIAHVGRYLAGKDLR